ncbi:MAG TPA: rRNA maturation RNase YbeY [Chitinophagaceae bacterium]|nr:rRNA maturation RNase YbeY [Chitinophagaceae bacterium]
MQVKSNIHFFFQSKIRLGEKTRLKTFLPIVFEMEGKTIKSLVYVFCSDKYLLKINQNFLKHDYYTDVITFDLSKTSKIIEGEIYISIDRVKKNSKEFKTSTNWEFLRVIFHGALHLCGYTDKTKIQKKEMRKREDKYLFHYSTFHVKQ